MKMALTRTRSGSAVPNLKNGGSLTSDTSFVMTEKLSFDSIQDKLRSQPDIFFNKPPEKESRMQFKDRMTQIVKWLCIQLLFDPFELVYWLSIIDDEHFDILNMRQMTNIKDLKYDFLMISIGLYLKSHLNYRNSSQQSEREIKDFKPTSNLVNCMSQTWCCNEHIRIWQYTPPLQ